jgi:siroheme synthase
VLCLLHAAQDLLGAAPAWAERLYVGKRGGTASIKQPQIDELLVALCKQVRQQKQA